MAYKQTPGGPMKQKTGHGIPSALLQDRKPNYKAADVEESEKGTGASFHATRILQNYPQQQKHLIKNVEKNPVSGKITSYETKIDAAKAVEQIQVAKDSMNYLSGIKDPKLREKAGRTFSFNFSPNNPYGKKAIERQGGEYQGPGKVSATQEEKQKVLTNLKVGAITGKNVTQQDEAQRVFGIAEVPSLNIPGIGANKVTHASKKKPAPKQMKSDSPAKMKVSKKTAYDIKEASNQKLKPGARKHYAENAQAAMKNKKGSAAKMKKC
jgi:hypothetical protein